METRTFNIIGVVVFGLFTVICTIAGFFNWVHFIFAAMCFKLAVLALNDDTGGKSLLDELKEKRTA